MQDIIIHYDQIQAFVYVKLDCGTWKHTGFPLTKNPNSILHEVREGFAGRYGDDPRQWATVDKPEFN